MGEKDFDGSVTMAEMPIKACTRLRGMGEKDFDGSMTMAEMPIKNRLKFVLLYCGKKNSGKSKLTILGSLFACFSSSELERHSDKCRSSVISWSTLKQRDLHAPFFP